MTKLQTILAIFQLKGEGFSNRDVLQILELPRGSVRRVLRTYGFGN